MDLFRKNHSDRFVVNFEDARLRSCYATSFTTEHDLPDERRHVHALISVYELAQTLDGPDSTGCHEAVWHMLLPSLRPELRLWFLHANNQAPGATALREHLSRLAEVTL